MPNPAKIAKQHNSFIDGNPATHEVDYDTNAALSPRREQHARGSNCRRRQMNNPRD
jgi:hypothetical protein